MQTVIQLDLSYNLNKKIISLIFKTLHPYLLYKYINLTFVSILTIIILFIIKNSLRLSDVSAKHFMSPTTSSVAWATAWAKYFKIFFTLKTNLLILLTFRIYPHFFKYYNILKRKKIATSNEIAIFLFFFKIRYYFLYLFYLVPSFF